MLNYLGNPSIEPFTNPIEEANLIK